MNNKKKTIFIGGGLIIILSALFYLFSISFPQNTSNIGLRKDHSLNPHPIPQTEQERLEEYESREEMPVNIQEEMYDLIHRRLSSGDFSDLDARLKVWEEQYKDNEDQSANESIILASYRGDLTYCNIISNPNNPPLSQWLFQTPDTLASAIAFAPVSMKYQALINQDSAILPPAKSNIHLEEVSLNGEDYRTRLAEINLGRTESDKFTQMKLYTFQSNGHDCEFTAIFNTSNMSWEPYSLNLQDEEPPVTVRVFKEMIDELRQVQVLSNKDIDSIIVSPATTE